MAMNDFVRRSMQIVAGGIVQSTTDYFDNAISFVNDVKEVKDMGLGTASESVKKFNELKQSGVGKKIRDWFYNEGGMFGDFDFDDDDFDAGFEIDSADSVKDEEKPLSKSMMSDISKKQTGAMYKAFGKQAEMSLANTAEIVSTINTRTAELTASVNNVNNTLIQIGKRLDLIVEWTSARTKQEQKEERKNSILDYGGGISLTGVANQFKANMEDSMLGTFLSIGKTMLGSGMMTPEAVLSMALSATLFDKKWKGLGNKSINDIGEFLNDTVGEVIQNAMTKVMTSQNEVLQSLFEDIITGSGHKNYQNSVVNQYNDKPAIFDGMTRKSIITIIPGYLNEILKAVNNGKGMNVDKKGNLTAVNADSFVQNVSDSFFRPGAIGWDVRKRIEERHTGIPSDQIANAVRTMTGVWVYYLNYSGRKILKNGEVTDMTAASTQWVVDSTADLLATKSKGKISKDEWVTHLWHIIMEIDEFKYRTELQSAAKRADDNLESFAKTHVNSHLARRVNWDVLADAFNQNYSEYNKSSSVTPTTIGSTTSASAGLTALDYTAGIFDRLNRGINVFITGQAHNRDKQYKKIRMMPGYAKRASGPADGDDASYVVKRKSSPGRVSTSTHVEPTTGKPDWYETCTDPHVREAYDAIEAGHGTDDDKKLVKEYKDGTKKGIKGAIKDWIAGTRKMGIIEDPESYEFISKMVDKVSGAMDKILPEKAKKIADDIKATETFQNVAEKVGNSKAVTTAKNSINKAAAGAINGVSNALYGNFTTWDGEVIQTGGLLEKAGNAKRSISERIADKTPTKILEHRAKKLLEDYGADKAFSADNSDALHMQVIGSMINVAMSNGDYSTIDDQALRKEMNEINDPELKRSLNQSVIPLMRKNSTSNTTSTTDSGSKPTSTIGKLAKLALGGIKMFLAPVITYVKVVLWGAFSIVKGVGTKLLSFAKWGIMRGLRQIKYGAKSLVSGIKGMMTPVVKSIRFSVDLISNTVGKLNDFVKKSWDKITNRFSKKGESASGEGEESGEKKSIYGKISGFKESVANKVSNNSFMRGFTQAYRDRKDAERKASMKEQAEPTVTALKDTGVPEIKSGVDTIVEEIGKINKSLSGEDGKGIAAEVKKQLTDVKDAIKDQNGGGGDTIKSDKKSDGTAGAVGTGFSIGQPETSTGDGGSWNAPSTKGATAVNIGGGKSKGSMPSGNSPATFTANMGGGADAAAGGKKGGMLESIGSTLGGIFSGVMGVVTIATTILSFFEAGKALLSFVKDLLMDSLAPLNDAIQALSKVLKPILKQLGGLIKQLAKFIVQVVDVLVDIIKPIFEDVLKPILEVLSPLLETIIACLSPLLKLVGIILKVVLAPFMGIFKFVVLPILKIIGDAVQIIMGVLQIGFGVLMMGIGGIISAIGGLISLVGKIPLLGAVGNVGEGILDTGKQMMLQGKDFVVQGGKSVAQGAVNIVLDSSFYTMGLSDSLLNRNQEETKETKKIEATDDDIVKNTYANGDITNIYNTYGGEYQRGMGGYLNMNQRGCGPIALADMYNRRGGGVSARSLAGSMYGSGAYDPNRGTSVGGYINTARSIGMNIRPGGVTTQSLKMASPTNPITVVGSGSDYGTRRGNNHFMNVIGTDSHGGAYVSNPLTGRVDRKPASTVAGSALIGLYGSGDEGDGGYSFPTAIKEAFKKLKSEASKILGLFSMDKSDDEDVADIISEEQDKQAVEQAKRQLGDEEYAKYAKEAKDAAFLDYQTQYPKRDGQSDDDYNKAFEKWYSTRESQYLAKTELMNAAKANNKDAWQTLQNTSDTFVNSYAGEDSLFDKLGDAYSDLNESTKSLGGSSSGGSVGGAGAFTTESGKSRLALSNPTMTDVDMTIVDSSIGDGGGYYHAPLLEFFSNTGGARSFLYGYNFYNKYGTTNKNDHTKEGVGTNGAAHQGIDLHWIGENANGKIPIYAPTDGTLELKQPEAKAAGGGNYVSMIDNDGNRHRFMHMHHFSDEINNMASNGKIVGGQTILGYEGNTGNSTGTHTHYDIYLNGGKGQRVNPLTYFSKYNPIAAKEGRISLTGELGNHSAWGHYSGNAGVPVFINAGKSAGMSPAEIATLMSTGIWEDSGQKIFGLKSLDGTTYDYNGQAAKGIMNWVDQNVNYGSTVADQLKYIHNTYFDANSSDWRAKVRNTGFEAQDLAAFRGATGRAGFTLQTGDRYGPYTNQDLIEGSAFFFMDALVPEKIHTVTGMAENVGTAADAYNWMIDNGYVTVDNPISPTGSGSVLTGYGMVNSPGDAQVLSNITQIGTSSGKNTGTVNTSTTGLILRSKPSTDGDALIEIPKGTRLNLEVSGSKDWFKTSYAGKTGFVYAHYIKLDKNETTAQYKESAGLGTSSTTQSINSAGDAAYYYGDTNVLTYTPKAASTVDNESKYDTDVKQILPANDPAWQATWYTKSTNYPYFMKQNNRGNYQPTSKGMIQRLNNMGNKLFVNIGKDISDRNQYWKNLQKDYGSVGDAENAMLAMYNEAGSPQEWMDRRHDYIVSTKTKDKNKFPDMLGDLHAAMYGSGDMSDSDFWDSYLGWNDGYINSNSDIPPIDESKFSSYSDDYATPSGIVVNRYNIKRADNTEAEARLRTILANTYNVRSETMEALLQEILDELRRRKNNGDKGGSAPSPKLFDERIPEQVSRLSIG